MLHTSQAQLPNVVCNSCGPSFGAADDDDCALDPEVDVALVGTTGVRTVSIHLWQEITMLHCEVVNYK